MGFEIAQISQYVFLVILLIAPGLAGLLMCGINARDLWQGGAIFLAPVMSIAIFSLPLFIAFPLKASLSLLGYAFLMIGGASVISITLALRGKQLTLRYREEGALQHLLLSCLFAGIVYVTFDAMRMNTVFGSDSLFHLARINKMITHAAAGNFNPLTGQVIEIGKAYANNFYHLLIAVLATLTGLKAITIWYFFEYMNVFILLMLTYSVSRMWFSNHVAFIITLLVFGTTFFLLDYGPDHTGTRAYAALYPYRYLFLNYPNAYVNKVLSLATIFLFFLYRDGKLRLVPFVALTCMVLFSAAGIHFIGAVLIFVGLSIFLITALLLSTGRASRTPDPA